jgi:hypothetical protein
VRSSIKKIPTKGVREARTTWQAVNSVGKTLPPAKGISMSLRYAHTAWRAFNSVGSLAAARQPRRGPETAAAEAKILIANARLEFRANH